MRNGIKTDKEVWREQNILKEERLYLCRNKCFNKIQSFLLQTFFSCLNILIRNPIRSCLIFTIFYEQMWIETWDLNLETNWRFLCLILLQNFFELAISISTTQNIKSKFLQLVRPIKMGDWRQMEEKIRAMFKKIYFQRKIL